MRRYYFYINNDRETVYLTRSEFCSRFYVKPSQIKTTDVLFFNKYYEFESGIVYSRSDDSIVGGWRIYNDFPLSKRKGV